MNDDAAPESAKAVYILLKMAVRRYVLKSGAFIGVVMVTISKACEGPLVWDGAKFSTVIERRHWRFPVDYTDSLPL